MLDFLKGKREPIALDIGGDSIKMLQMQQVGGALSVRACGRWRYPDIPAADKKQRHELAISAVREMLRKEDFRGRRVVSALSMMDMHIKNIRLSAMPEQDLPGALAAEAQQRFEMADVRPDQLGYLNAGEVRQGVDIRQEIILMGVPSVTLNDHLEMLDLMGLRIEHIEPEPLSLFRSLERFLRRAADEQAVSVLVDVGVSAARVIVARGRQIVFLKAIEIGGRKFTEVVASHLNLSYAEASELRTRIMMEQSQRPRDTQDQRDQGDALRWTVFDAMRGEVESLAKEIALCLRYCSVTFRGLRFSGVTLTGGEAYDPALRDLMSQHLNLPCTVGQPLRGIDVSGLDLGNRRGNLAEWAVCTGLALRDLDTSTLKEDDHGEHRLSA